MRHHSRRAPRFTPIIAMLIVTGACTVDTPAGDPRKDAGGNATQSAAVCRRTAEGEAGDLALARCLATADELLPAGKTGESQVVVYFDRSASMRGFLDPSYPTRIPTDYRSVIDRLVVGLRPTRGFSFGSALRPAEPSL